MVTQKVSLAISDLFFMLDMSPYRTNENEDNNHEYLFNKAIEFCYHINELGFSYTPTDIVNDYLERI